jgi:membrane-bound ClpP family serine protease
VTFLEVLGWVVRQDILDIRSRSAFGILLCGALVGVIGSIIAVLKLNVLKGGLDVTPMNYQDVLVIIMTAATFFLGVIIPLAGIFAFVFFRRDIRQKTEELIEEEMKEKGKLRSAMEAATNKAIEDEQGVVRQFLVDIVKKEVERQTSKTLNVPTDDFGNEQDEYGDVVAPKEGK